MSDLAPFVANVLRDRTVFSLMEEIEELRKRINRSTLLQIISKKGGDGGGEVVLFEGSLADGQDSTTNNGEYWVVKLRGVNRDSSDSTNSSSSIYNNAEATTATMRELLRNFEIRLGGTYMGTFITDYNSGGDDSDKIYRRPGPSMYDHGDDDWNTSIRIGISQQIKNDPPGSAGTAAAGGFLRSVEIRKTNIAGVLALVGK